MADTLTADEVLGYLTDVDYPADKDALLSAAERRGASDEVLRSIRAIPPVDYRGRDEVVRSLRLDPAPDRSDGTRAAQARADVPPGVAQPTRPPRRTG